MFSSNTALGAGPPAARWPDVAGANFRRVTSRRAPPKDPLPEPAAVPQVPSVYSYTDYRAFLREHFAASKATKSFWSHRYFARKAGLSSSNFLKLVMDGKRNLGTQAVGQFAKALLLGEQEAAFFADLVTLSQADTVAERNRAFERVASNRRFRSARRLEGPLFEYLTHWYYPVVRELAARSDFAADPKWIREHMRPTITLGQARAALATLQKLGLVVHDEATGRLVRGEPTLTTGHEVRSVAVRAYHRQMIEQAGLALEDVPPDERDISALTVCVRASTIGELKQRVHRFREEMLDLCDREESPERVYQLNIQLFPLTR